MTCRLSDKGLYGYTYSCILGEIWYRLVPPLREIGGIDKSEVWGEVLKRCHLNGGCLREPQTSSGLRPIRVLRPFLKRVPPLSLCEVK